MSAAACIKAEYSLNEVSANQNVMGDGLSLADAVAQNPLVDETKDKQTPITDMYNPLAIVPAPAVLWHSIALSLALVAILGLAGLIWLLLRSAARRANRPGHLKPHYVRLGQVAPDEPCPCHPHSGGGRTYGQCCRQRDVQRLQRDVRDDLWRRWSRRSYGGRKRMRSMKNRLREFPLPKADLPDWVTNPNAHEFPIPQDLLRHWTPMMHSEKKPAADDLGRAPFDDLPF